MHNNHAGNGGVETTPPNLILLSTARADESALADKTDGELNVFLADKFSAVFNDFLHEPQGGFRSNVNFRMSDIGRKGFSILKDHFYLVCKLIPSIIR